MDGIVSPAVFAELRDIFDAKGNIDTAPERVVLVGLILLCRLFSMLAVFSE